MNEKEKRETGWGIDDQLIIALRDVHRTMHSLYEGKSSQRRILMVLSDLGETSQRDLTRRLDVMPGTASETLAKLEAAGLIARTPSEEDRRGMIVRLTEEGALQAAQARAQRQARHREMFACLTEEEKQALLALLGTINGDWAARYPRKGRGK